MGKLTTHVLDTANGRPAAAVAVRAYRLAETRELVGESATNRDGRTDTPLVEGRNFESGVYELEFDIGAYFGDGESPSAPFLDTVVIRVRLHGDETYHVPLLASPWSYSTYRGS